MGKAMKANSDFIALLEIKSDSQPHVIFFVLVAKDVPVVHGKLLVIVTERLANRQLVKESERGPPAFAAIVNRRPEKVSRMLVHGGIGKFVMVPKFQTG